MLTLIFQLIRQKLQQISYLKEVDWYINQFTQEGEFFLTTTPGVYLQFGPIKAQPFTQKVQLLEFQFQAHLVNECLYDNAQRMIDNTIHNHHALIDQVFITLQNRSAWLSDLPAFAALAGTGDDNLIFNELVRDSIQPDHVASNLITTTQSFSGVAYDYTAEAEFIDKIANLVTIVN